LAELLGRGGMGEVWKAFDTDTDRVVAVKILPKQLVDDAMFQERFRREARAAAGLNEPHVVPIHAFGEMDGRLYVDMKLIKGRDLQSIVADGPLDPDRAVNIIEQVASALAAAHQGGLVHRDVKPSNILVAADDFAYLIDFGIARAAGETGLTSMGATIGTWAYMAPERIESGKVDPRSDVYSLACVLHECLTGQRPFPGESFEQLAAAHIRKPPPTPSELRFGLARGLDHVVARGMAKNPSQRFPTTRALARAARQAITPTAPHLSARPAPQAPTVQEVPPTVAHHNPSVSPGTGPTQVGGPPRYQAAPAATPPPFHGSRQPPTSRRRVIIFGSLAVAIIAAIALTLFFVL
jgi:serine/threonine protein kinase